MTSDRNAELRARIDQLAAEYADILAGDDQPQAMLDGAVLVTSWVDPTDPELNVWVATRGGAGTSDMARIGLTVYAAARAVE